MFQVLLALIMIGVGFITRWSWLHYGAIGLFPAVFTILLLFILYYDGKLFAR